MPKRQITEAEFETTFDRYRLPVFRFALAWTNDWAAAEDLTQDAFLKLWARRDDLDWSEPLLPWLLTATHRLATDRFRRLRTALGVRAGGGSGESALDSDARLRWLDLQPRLGQLSQVQRAALVLTAVVGLSSEQAAVALGTSAGAVRAAVSRARATLGDE